MKITKLIGVGTVIWAVIFLIDYIYELFQINETSVVTTTNRSENFYCDDERRTEYTFLTDITGAHHVSRLYRTVHFIWIIHADTTDFCST